MNPLNARNKEFCIYSGIFGILFSLTCLLQHFWYTNPHWITALLAVGYVYSVIAFALLAAQRNPAPILLIANTFLLLIASFLLLKNGIFSLVVIATFIYTGVILVFVYMAGLPGKFKQKAIALREEKATWQGKI